ncbi:MAG TPA: hypothetical protein VMZ91_06135 [Candidatus Paceibacterota bacterium]|nr:hypothetical protein [Candidatus Paceibacterota bacterium]
MESVMEFQEAETEDKKDEAENKARLIQAIADMENEDFSDFYSKIQDFMATDEEEGVVICPDSKIEARNWVFAFVKMKEEIDFLKKELIPALIEKYIKPSKDRIEQLESSQGFVKDGLFEFLRSIGEKKVSFPSLATVSEAKTQPKVIYPEDEKALIEKLVKEKSKYIVNKPSLDKKAILAEFKEKGELPFDELIGEAASTAIRVTMSKARKSDS